MGPASSLRLWLYSGTFMKPWSADNVISTSDALIEVGEQLRKNAIEANGLILRLPALRTEQVIDVGVAVPADRENIGDASRVVAELFALDCGLDEVERQQVAERSPHHCIVVGLARLLGAAHDRMGKAPPEILGFRGPRPIIR